MAVYEDERQFSAVCIAMFNASFIISVFRFLCKLSRFCIGQLSVKMRRFPCALFGHENKDESY